MNNRNNTILIVDDDIDILEQTKQHLEMAGYETIRAENQKEAEEILESMKPDLAVLDLMMENPDSGFVLSYKIKRKFPDVPIIIVTAVTCQTKIPFGPVSPKDYSWIKADVVIEKEIRYEQLIGEVKRLLN